MVRVIYNRFWRGQFYQILGMDIFQAVEVNILLNWGEGVKGDGLLSKVAELAEISDKLNTYPWGLWTF